MNKNEWIKYTNDIIKSDGVYLDFYRAHMLTTGLKNIRNLLLMMTNTTDDVRFNKALQMLCEMSRLMNQAFNLKG